MKWLLAFVVIFISLTGYSVAKSAISYLEQGEKAYNDQRYTTALASYRSALEINPNYKEAKVGMGKAFYQLSNYEKALKFFMDAERQFQNDYMIKVWIAKTRIKQKRYDSAKAYLIKAIFMYPRDSNTYMVYGDLYFAKQNYYKAISNYAETLKIVPKDTKALIKTARCYLRLNKQGMALDYFEKAEDIDNKNPLTNYYLGDYYYNKKDYENANQHLRISLMVSPLHIPSMEILSRVLYEKEEWEESKSFIEKLVSLNPKNKIYYYNLALVYEKLDKPLLSINTLIEGLNIDVGDEAMRYQAEEIYHSYSSHPEVKKLGASFANYWVKKGKSYLRQRLPNYAFFAFRRARRINPSFKVRFELAKIYKSKGFVDRYNMELEDIKETLSPVNREFNDELRFSKRGVKRLLSKREGINQYDLPKIKPKIVLLPFSKNTDFNNHYGVDELYRKVLYTTLKMKDRLNVVMIDENTKSVKGYEHTAKAMNADFIIRGEVKESRLGVEVKLNIYNLRDGEVFKTVKIYQRGSDRFLVSAIYLSNRIEELFPVFAKIVRKNYKELIITLGKRHGYKKGDRFYVIPEDSVFKRILTNKDLINIVRDRSTIEQLLLSYLPKPRYGLEEIEIEEVDENISKARLMTSDFFDQVNINDYIIYKPR
jgi:tetratricopeptide (TPR) repeat protein